MKNTLLSKDLSKQAPVSPRHRLAGYVIAGRAADKCRAGIAGTIGSYHYDCPLDNMFFTFKGITSSQFKSAVKNAKSEKEIGEWLAENGKKHTTAEIKTWSDETERSSMINNPETKAAFTENCKKAGLNPETASTFDWLDADDKAGFKH
jgi:hypothetical protein